MRKQAILLAAIAAVGASAQAPLWMRDVKISPDGSAVAFAYKGDIWTVPAAGGNAVRLTSLPSYEASPVWSPDGKRIAFSSDRYGNSDIFVMDAAGGPATRLTSDSASETPEAFTPDGTEVLYSAAIQAPASSAAFPSGRMAQLWAAKVDGSGVRRQVLATPAQMPAFLPDGGFIYQDLKGFEDEWRKHHTSSVTRDLWRYDAKTGKHTNLTSRGGEDRNPSFDPATSTVYFLSERDGGTMNVYSAPLSDMSKASAVTSFKTHPVRFLSRAADGTLAFTYDGEIYTMKGGNGVPAKLAVAIAADDAPSVEKIELRPGGAVPSPDGKQMAFISRGDVFVTSVEYPTTRQVTSTPQAERHISWGKDNRALYYTSERSGRKNIYRATLDREADPDFPNATSIKEEALFDDGAEYSHPMVSPDGKKLAFVKNRRNIMVMDLPSGKPRQLTAGETYPGRDDGIVMTWSPDSRWLAMEMTPKMHDPYSDIALLNVETGKLTNITRSGYFDASPRFTQDGNALLFMTDRYGMRAHASWGSQTDLMIVFLNREARDRFDLSKEDLALLKESEKGKSEKVKGEKGEKKKDKKGEKGEKDEKGEKEVKPIVVELDGIETRIRRLTPYSADIVDAIGSADGETLYYVVSFGDDYMLYKLPVREMEPEKVVSLGESPASLSASADGKTIFASFGKSMRKLNGSKLDVIKTSGKHTIDRAKEREAMFDYVAVEEGERFYTPDMHGVDWPAMTAAYRRFLPHINNNYDFAEMLSELLGELNVSHTGGRYRPWPSASADRTANLGLLYDLAYTGDGLKVDEVIVDGPFDKASSKMVPGAVITAVNGTAVTPATDTAALLTDLAGRKTLVEFTLPSGEKVSEVVKPVSAGAVSDLMYKRWVRNRAADVERWSGGRLGYVHIEQMADESFRPMYADLFGKYNNCDGVVVDIRWNGGGRMHEDIEALLTGQKYLTQVIRGEETCDMPSRRWNKPSIMVMAEPCYSNAHGTPWVYKHQKIGKLVGMPVPGTMTSVNWVTLQDPTLVFGIPVIGYRTAEGTYLENSQLEPDVRVVNTPEALTSGEDLQLKTAVETLLRDIDSRK